MDLLNSDLLIQTISYLDVIDSSSFSASSRRMYYLTHQFRRILGPQLSTSSSSLAWEAKRCPPDNYKQCLSRLSVKPNFALTFTGETGQDLCSHIDDVAPDGLVLLNATSSGIQANCDDRVEHDIDATLMLGNFPPERTKIVPFNLFDCDASSLIEKVEGATPVGENVSSYWKVFIVYVCGSGYYSTDNFVSTLQKKHPDAAIVGGICESGHVSVEATKDHLSTKSRDELQNLLNNADDDLDDDALLNMAVNAMKKRKYMVEEVDDAIFGIAFGGDVPVRSIVSRGVKSVTGGDSFSEEPSRWVVEEVDFARPGEEDYMFRGDPTLLKPTHVIRTVRDNETGKTVSPLAILASAGASQPEFIGLRRPTTDGYELHGLSPFSLQANSIVLMTDGSPEQEASILNADVDFFSLDWKSCLDHMDSTLEKLKVQTKDEVILGGIMYSCNGRGPERRSMLREEMADAKRFHKHFPGVDLCGFYAGGEIGPMAMVGKRDIFRSGKAAVQGFTAVFALFIVPAMKPGAFYLDDSPDNVLQFVAQAMQEQQG